MSPNTTPAAALDSAPAAKKPTLSKDLSALTKPRITLMVVLTTLVGYWVAAPMFEGVILLHTLLGTALLSTGSSILNQWVERHTDGAMRRTSNRPLPSGRLSPGPALVSGLAISAIGASYLYVLVNPLTCWVGVVSLGLYVVV